MSAEEVVGVGLGLEKAVVVLLVMSTSETAHKKKILSYRRRLRSLAEEGEAQLSCHKDVCMAPNILGSIDGYMPASDCTSCGI